MLSETQKFLEHAFTILNKHYFKGQLPRVVITIQSSPKTNGYITTNKLWNVGEEQYREINISAENMSRPAENVMATLLHEMVHLYNMEHGVEDTSKNGRYHNKAFKNEAEKHDLKIEYIKYYGYTKTIPTDAFVRVLEQYDLLQPLDKFRNTLPSLGTGTKRKSRNKKYVCPTGCGTRVRAAKPVNVLCGECGKQMEEYE